MQVLQMAERFAAVVREEGLSSALGKLVSLRPRTASIGDTCQFDAAFETDTLAEVPLWRLQIPSNNVKYGSRYQTVDPSAFAAAVGVVPVEANMLHFIDLGCGKGRTLILAAQQGFHRVTGVEFSPDLARIARENLAKVRVIAEVVQTDVCDFAFPQSDLLIYMYNPFGPPVMESVINNLVAWRGITRKQAYIVYVNPKCHSLFDAHPQFDSIASQPEVRVWKFAGASTI